jgi:hypothetical protein
MRRALAAGAVLAAVAVAPGAGAGERGHAYALVSKGVTATLVELDPATLRQTDARSLPVGRHDLPWARSPDGSQLLIGSGRTTSLVAVDLEHLRTLREIRLPGMPSGLAWPTARRALVVVPGRCCPSPLRLVALDPQSGRVVASRRLGTGSLMSAARVPAGLVLLIGGATRIEPSRIVVARADGRVREVVVRGIPAGYESHPGPAGTPVSRNRRPGLAVDPSGRHAYLVGPHAAAVVDLRTGAIVYHALRERQLAACLDGCGLSEGSYRTVAWVLPGRLAISGYDDKLVGTGTNQTRLTTPVGLRLLSTRTWTMRRLDATTSSLSVAGGVLLGYGAVWSARTGVTTSGIRGYGLDGRRRFVALRDRSVSAIPTFGNLAYVGLNDGYRSHAVRVIDLRRGRVVARPLVEGAVFLVGDTPSVCWC